MKALLRKLRGMLGLGAIWAIAWIPLTVLIGTVELLLAGRGLPTLGQMAANAVTGARSGFIAGVLFGAGLGLVYRSRLLRDLRSGAVGVLGGLGGVLVGSAALLPGAVLGTLPLVAVGLVMAYCGVFGALTAVGALKLARADPKELEPGRAPEATPVLNA